MMSKITILVRVLLSCLLVSCVYQETGPATAIAVGLNIIAIEALTYMNAKALAAVNNLASIYERVLDSSIYLRQTPEAASRELKE